MTESNRGLLYLVATPIGNLADLTPRAVEVLAKVDLIAAEDTRRTRVLLDHCGIAKPLLALHQHNERVGSERLIERMIAGESIALVSDAGTPLISDPGYLLVRDARRASIVVSPVPGPCALIAALSASGLPADRFVFEGFLPRKSAARIALLESVRDQSRTHVFYESSHRIVESLSDFARVFGSGRRLVVARELTKFYESITDTSAAEAATRFAENPEIRKGEFVLVLEGAPQRRESDGLPEEQQAVLALLLQDCSVKTSVDLMVRLTGAKRGAVYSAALALTQANGGGE